ncbi:hypothetical protein B484DRAFT_460162, partial [Ochromonadaceae sp. CCMP2298]
GLVCLLAEVGVVRDLAEVVQLREDSVDAPVERALPLDRRLVLGDLVEDLAGGGRAEM